MQGHALPGEGGNQGNKLRETESGYIHGHSLEGSAGFIEILKYKLHFIVQQATNPPEGPRLVSKCLNGPDKLLSGPGEDCGSENSEIRDRGLSSR